MKKFHSLSVSLVLALGLAGAASADDVEALDRGDRIENRLDRRGDRIENRLDEHPSVRECAVVGVEHDTLGQEVKAVVVTADEGAVDPDALARFVAETLAPYKVPSQWELRSEPLPRNAAGKILKNVLAGQAELQQVDE